MSDALPTRAVPPHEVPLPERPPHLIPLVAARDLVAAGPGGAAVVVREVDGAWALDAVSPAGAARPVPWPDELGTMQAAGVDPGGRWAWIADRRRVMRFEMDDGDPQVLYEAPPNDAILSAASAGPDRLVVLTLDGARLVGAVAALPCPPGTMLPGPVGVVLVESGAGGVIVLKVEPDAPAGLAMTGTAPGVRLAHVCGDQVYGRTDDGWVTFDPRATASQPAAEAAGEDEAVAEVEVTREGEREVTAEIDMMPIDRADLDVPEIPGGIAARFGTHAWVHVSANGRYVALTCEQPWIYDRVAFLEGDQLIHCEIPAGQLRTLNVRNDGAAALFGDTQTVWELRMPEGATRMLWRAPEPGLCGVHYVADDLFGAVSAEMLWLVEVRSDQEADIIAQAPINQGVGVVSALDGKALAVLTRGPEPLLIFGVDAPRLKLIGTITAPLAGAESTAKDCYVYDREQQAYRLANVEAAWKAAFR